ncbi:MAG: DUF4855 domain-containing protein [Clostridia bacterium]|nr:DUF4855 domain-containing protein [Clostridia bacterium]
MKRFVSLSLCFALLITAFSFLGITASAKMPDPSELNGYENLCLTYTFNTSRYDNGRHTVEDLRPYVAYYDEKGNIKDYFFDSYLFLPCVQRGPSGAPMHASSDNPTKAIDWTSFVKDTFADGYNVDALEAAFGNAKNALGDPDKKAGVFFTILYPTRTSTSFGVLDGKSLDFSKKEDRKYAIKWIIDEQLRLYNEAGYKNLELVGFYWLEEYLMNYSHTEEDKELFNYAADYLHSLGLKFIWIPWYKAYGYSFWDELGFDVACMQPNLFWMSNPDSERVADSIELSSQYGLSMEMEIDYNAFSSNDHFERYLTYLEDGMKYGAMDSVKMYYQGGKTGVYYAAATYSGARHRVVYDLTYKYAKGTLTQSDIDMARADLYGIKDIEWVSIGKTYTASQAHVGSGGDSEYQNISGKELTDGILASSELGTEWHSFHTTLTDSDGYMNVTVDLGEIRNDLKCFVAQFNNCDNYGIGYPGEIRISISENGTNFKLLCEPKLDTSGLYSFIKYECGPVRARYVKLSFINKKYNFVFCSEFLIGADKNASKKVIGDVDGNATVEAKDYYLCKRAALKTFKPDNACVERGDVNGNGVLDATDYALIKRHVLGTYKISE